MKKILIIFISITTLSLAQSAGNSGLSFLKFGFGARNIAMGDAGNAISNDVTALFYNPANLVGSTNAELLFMHNEWIEDIRSEVGGAKFSMFGLPFAFGFNVTTIGDIEVRSQAGEPESKFNANYFFGSLSTGFYLFEGFSIGFTGKYLYEGYFINQATGLAFDIGVKYTTATDGLSASAVIKNLGSMSQLRNEKTMLPAEFRIGPAYTFNLADSKFDMTTAVEVLKYLETDDFHINIGAEILYDKLIALRGGYISGHEFKSFTGGIGLIWGSLGFDYALSPFNYGLGSRHTISLSFKF
jgi:hypothetical protein